MHLDQDSHTTMRHGTAPQKTKPSRLHGADQAGRQVYKKKLLEHPETTAAVPAEQQADKTTQ